MIIHAYCNPIVLHPWQEAQNWPIIFKLNTCKNEQIIHDCVGQMDRHMVQTCDWIGKLMNKTKTGAKVVRLKIGGCVWPSTSPIPLMCLARDACREEDPEWDVECGPDWRMNVKMITDWLLNEFLSAWCTHSTKSQPWQWSENLQK